MTEAYGGNYPYGPVYVKATTIAADGGLEYHGSQVILEPSVEGDAFTLEVSDTAGEIITVYGALDADGDGTIHSSDPTGLYPHDLDFSQSDVLKGIDLSILVAYDPDLVGQNQSWEGGVDGGQGCSDLAVSGPVQIAELGEGRRGVVMLVDSLGAGPVDWVWFDAEEIGTGGRSEYSIPACVDLGELLLVGAFDTNGNEVIDPEDQWGAWTDGDGNDQNPLSIGSQDLLDHWIEIPTGDGSSPLDLVPFVHLAGTVSVEKGSFDDLESGTTITVAALKYRPSNDITVGDLESLAYDHDVFLWPDLTGESIVDFRLGVPADTVVYLWAFADEDMDDVINESGERVASGGSDGEGTYVTGSSDSQQHLPLAYADDER
jgi:hypothetical protein